MHCSPMACSSSADMPWIKPSLSGEVSADWNDGVDIARGGEREGLGGEMFGVEPRLAVGQRFGGTGGYVGGLRRRDVV